MSILLLPLLWVMQKEWSDRTFGDAGERGPTGPLRHLEHEAREAQADPDDLEEYADCFLLILDAVRRAGFSLGQLIWSSFRKHLKNRRRKWAKPTSEEPVFHTEEGF